ncbi:major facilitator superfamily permease [Streptomyces hygroscopicus subsp. jinggangensis 5008]|nr:major facilitator superfamily permease [Streptomyces hygroscopicus subsp. jinggangensis 5008]AGF60532.1 major facilitator superfamily permease [Streptomyces hygroscopicus subsp. jinggangensis TL01]
MSFVLVLSEFLPVGLLPAIGDSLHVNTGTAGLLLVVPGLAAAVAAPLLTVASGRLDRRHVLLTLAALITVSNALAALAPNMTVMIAARLLLGLGVGGFWAMGAGVGSRLVAPADADRAASFITAGISAGTVVSLPLGALIGHLAGWRTAFDVAAVAALLTLVFPTDTMRPASLDNVLRTPSAALTGLILATAVLLLTVTTSTPFVIALVLLWGAAFGGVPPIGQARVTRLFPQAPEAALALLVTASQTFLAVGSFTGGVLPDPHGTSTAFTFGALVVLLSALVPVRTR